MTQDHSRWHPYLFVLIVAAAIYVGCIVSPPSLLDDVDAMQAQVARNMLVSGGWVTPRLDGVVYLEKAPLIYWNRYPAGEAYVETTRVACPVFRSWNLRLAESATKVDLANARIVI